MNRVAAEIAVEISMLFQHGHGHAGSGEQITSHHPGWSATHNHATRLQFLRRIHLAAVFGLNILLGLIDQAVNPNFEARNNPRKPNNRIALFALTHDRAENVHQFLRFPYEKVALGRDDIVRRFD